MALKAVSSAVAILCLALTLCVKAAEVEASSNATARRLNDDCNCVCGQSRSSRVVGGARTERGEFPWLAALFSRGWIYFCGGSLITERHVLTAAHCFQKISPTTTTVQLGGYDIEDSSEKPLIRNVKKVTKHPDYTGMNGDYDSDVAIVELDEPVTFGAWNIGTACLPDATYVDYTGEESGGGDWGTLVGRGRTTEGGKKPGIPLKVDLPLLSMKACRATGYGPYKITDNMICAGFPSTGKKDACQGDSGGPLHKHLDNTDVSTYEVVGVVSWGYGCARPRLPGVYARVQKFVPWIRTQIAGTCECRRE